MTTAPDAAALADCPFCGNDGSGPIEEALHISHTQNDWHPHYDCYSVQCDKCTATMGYSETPEDAAEAWNTRAALRAKPAGEAVDDRVAQVVAWHRRECRRYHTLAAAEGKKGNPDEGYFRSLIAKSVEHASSADAIEAGEPFKETRDGE